MSNLGDLDDQIRNSEAFRVFQFINELSDNHYVVFRNFQELYRFLEHAEREDSGLWNNRNRDQLDKAMRELTRLLLNFLASAKARATCNSRMLKARYGEHPFWISYRREIKRRFIADPLAEFVEGLRNYSLHYALPYAGAHWQYKAATESQGAISERFFALDKQTLLSSGWQDWGKKGQRYLDESDGEIVIRTFTTAYYVKAHNSQVWVEEQLRSLHKEELEWLFATNAEAVAQWDQFHKNVEAQLREQGKGS